MPAVVRFKPDLILVSAGFDAHRKDDINYAYIGVTEKDYEWLTDQIVQVANRCATLPPSHQRNRQCPRRLAAGPDCCHKLCAGRQVYTSP